MEETKNVECDKEITEEREMEMLEGEEGFEPTKFDPNRSFNKKRAQCLEKKGIFEGGKIRCDCCGESYSPTNWEKHAGSAQKRPYTSIILEGNLTLTQYRNQLNFDIQASKKNTSKRSINSDDSSITETKSKKESTKSFRPYLFSSTNQPKRNTSERKNRKPNSSEKKQKTERTNKNEVSDYFIKGWSPLSDPNVLKNLVQPELMNYLNFEEREFLLSFLPQTDQQINLEILFKSEGFQSCIRYWAEMLRQGQFDPKRRDALNDRRERNWASEPWKKDYFFKYWGNDLIQFSSTDSILINDNKPTTVKDQDDSGKVS